MEDGRRVARDGVEGRDEWGIDRQYLDFKGDPHACSPETHAALVAAMGGDRERRAQDRGGKYADVVVLRGGAAWTAPRSGEIELEGGEIRRVIAGQPLEVPLGYHELRLAGEDRPVRVIGCPERCQLPDAAGVWGLAAQLYATRSRDSWGIGDLGDLARLGTWARGLGASLLMINPLSATAPVLPIEPSPYYPSSRRYRSPIYVDVEHAPGAEGLGEELVRLGNLGRGLNDRRLIERDAVFLLKMRALEACFGRAREGDATGFEAYRRREGRALQQFATYCALAERHGKDWRRWPEELRSAEAPAVYRFEAENDARISFHAWMQWVLDEQARSAAARIGLVQDLPIGLDVAGADAWSWQEMLASGVSVGAPPDEFNPAGQDWGLVPFVPHKLRGAGYQPFVETIRAIARYSAGIRIDHVMGLFKLYWIPQALGAAQGAYVRFRADELLGILALESARAGAFVVGEDLGTVEPGAREQLAERGLLSYRLVYFEDAPPAGLPELALSTVSTHDLPTIAGLDTGDDLRRARCAQAPQNEEGLRRLRDKLRALAGATADTPTPELIASVYRALSAAPSRVLLATLEDALGLPERPNIPGANGDWPNWSLALPIPLEELESHPLPPRIARALTR